MASENDMRELFWTGFCMMLPVWSILFAFNLVATFMLLFSFPFLDPGSSTFVVAVMDVGALALAFTGVILAIRKCGHRQKTEYKR